MESLGEIKYIHETIRNMLMLWVLFSICFCCCLHFRNKLRVLRSVLCTLLFAHQLIPRKCSLCSQGMCCVIICCLLKTYVSTNQSLDNVKETEGNTV